MSKPSNGQTTQHFSLDIIFGSRLRVKVMRFLYRNYPQGVSARELARRVQEPLDAVRSEIKNLQKINLIKRYNEKDFK